MPNSRVTFINSMAACVMSVHREQQPASGAGSAGFDDGRPGKSPGKSGRSPAVGVSSTTR